MPQQDSNFKKRNSLAVFKQAVNIPAENHPAVGMLGAGTMGAGAVRVGNSILRGIVRKLIPSPAVIKSVAARPAPGSGLARLQRDLASLPPSKARPAPAKKDAGTTPTGSSSVGYRKAPLPGSAAARPRGGDVPTRNKPGPQYRDRK